jgi:3-oxoadipate enol-lactonase
MSIELHTQLEGPEDGPAVVLVNSLGTDLSMWDAQIGPLTERFRVLRYDTRGHGRSDVPDGPYTMTDLAADVLDLLDAEGIERASVCGVSLGGMTAMHLALDAPERLDRIALCQTTGGFRDPETWQGRIDAVREQGMDAVVDGTLERWFTPDAPTELVARYRAMLEACPPEGYAACSEAILGHDVIDQLEEIGVPTLVVAGDDDLSTPLEPHGRALAEGIPGARLEVIEHARHIANAEQPEAFNRVLLDFLS